MEIPTLAQPGGFDFDPGASIVEVPRVPLDAVLAVFDRVQCLPYEPFCENPTVSIVDEISSRPSVVAVDIEFRDFHPREGSGHRLTHRACEFLAVARNT